MAKKQDGIDMSMLSQVLMGGGVVAVVLSAVGYLGTDIWLASTQWLLVASVLALFAVYFKQ
jgi:small-conductance mechanosensitive channel